MKPHFLLSTLAFLIVAASAATVSAQTTSTLSPQLSTTSSGWGKGGKPKPTPTPTPRPADAQQAWRNTSGNTNFNTAASWNGGAGPVPTTGDVAAFSGAAVAQPKLSASVSIAGVYFKGTTATGYTLSNTTAETLTLTASGTTIGAETGDTDSVAIGAENTGGTNTITAPIILAPSGGGTNSTIFQATGGTLTISGGGISGSGISLTKTGGGILNLNVANTYSGGTFVNSGTVNFNNSNSLGGTNPVTLGVTGGGDATLTASVQLGLSNNFTVASGSGGTLTLGTTTTSATTSTWSGTLTLNDNVNLTSAQAGTVGLSLTGAISGAGGINKVGAGLLTLGSASNSYAGSTTITNGTLQIGSTATLGSGAGSLILSGGTLNMSASRAVTGAPVISNNVSVTANSAITTTSSASSVTTRFSGTLTGTGGTLTIRNDGADQATDLFDVSFSGSDYTMSRPIILDNGTTGKVQMSDFNTTGTTHTYNGVISGTGSYNRSATTAGTGGTTIFNANNSYTGTTTVSNGTLFVNGDQTSATGTTTVTNSGSILGGTGTIGGAVSIATSGAILEGGTGSTGQTLTIKGSLTQVSGSIIELALGPTLTHSTLALTGAGPSSFYSTQKFTFIDVGATAGTFQNIITGVTSDPGTGSWTITNSGYVGTFSWDGANIDLNLTAVPEPSTWIAGGLALLAVCYTQRRRFARVLKRA